MGEADDKMLKAIKHYQESLERHTKTGKSEKLLHAIGKLSLLPIRVWHLEETGVGRTVNGLKKFEGTVGEHARNLVDKWKFMVKGEEEIEEKVQYDENSIKKEKGHAEPVEECRQTLTDDANSVDEKPSFQSHASNHSKSKSSNRSRQSSRDSNQSKIHISEGKSHKRHHSKNNYTNSPSDSDIASKRHKVIKSESKHKHSSHGESESDNESDISNRSQGTSKRTQYDSSSSHSTSESSDNSSSASSESSSSDEDETDKKHDHRKRNSSNDSDSDDSRHKESSRNSNGKRNKKDFISTNAESHKIDGSKKRHKTKQSDSSDGEEVDVKSKTKSNRDTAKSSSKNEKYSSHHDSKRESSKSRHSSEKSKQPELNSKLESSKYKQSKSTESESSNRRQDKSKDRDSHRSSSKTSKSEDTRKSDSKKEEYHKEKKDDKNETVRKRSRETSSSRESKKYKNNEDNKDSRRSHEHSSSSKGKDKAREKQNDRNEIQKDTHRSSSKKARKDKSYTSAESKVIEIPKKLLDGIDSGSGTSFADVLGMLEAPVYSKSKKKNTVVEEAIPYSPKKTSSTPKEDKTAKETRQTAESSSVKTNSEIPNLLKDPTGLDPLDINMSSLLPSITPNYRPLGVTLDDSRKMFMDEEAFSRVISAKHQRTKVYSGNKAGYLKVPTLFDLCSRILQDNLDALEYTGGVPYSILKHILEKANPNQLYQLEFHNPYLIEDSDELWQLHCQKEFRNKKREELESWREMYLRCLDEREAKLKALTANIKQSQDKSIPVRQTKLAYVDSVVKPPRNVARKQIKNGIAINIQKPSQTPTERLNQLAKSGEAAKIAVPNPSRSAVERSSSHSSHIKPKKAPLMAKTLSLLKNRFGRR